MLHYPKICDSASSRNALTLPDDPNRPRRCFLPGVQILLALRNGGTYLGAQLDSIEAQSRADWSLLASDDKSHDHGPDLLRDFAARHPGKVRMIDGPATGAAANFMHLLRESDPEARHLAFCDQDDVWLPHKIERALAMLAEQPEETPVLYCSRTLVCNATLQEQCASRMPRRTPSFRNALVQNIVAGNTIVLNETASRLAREEAGRVQTVAVHDWWLYQLITAVGGTVIYDETPGLLYRQHGANEIGVHTGFHASLWRVAQVLSGRYRRWNELNVAALAQSTAAFTPENRARFEAFAAGRGGSLPRRVIMLGRTGVHRQSRVGNAALWLSAVLGRL